jgi:hypothetical protein
LSQESPANALDLVERIARGHVGAAVLGVWAAAEAVVLPIVPDVGLGILVMTVPSRAARLFAAVLVGALAGTLVLATFASQAPDEARGLVLRIPAIDAAVLADAEADLARDGIAGFAQLGPGPPLKVYTVEWLRRGGDIAGAVVGTILNRITRIGPVLLVAAAIGYVAGPWFRRHARLTLVAYATVWLLFYVAWFSSSA